MDTVCPECPRGYGGDPERISGATCVSKCISTEIKQFVALNSIQETETLGCDASFRDCLRKIKPRRIYCNLLNKKMVCVFLNLGQINVLE